MKAHNLHAIGFLKLDYTPTEPDHAVRLADLESVAGAGAQPVFVTDVEPLGGGNVGAKTYADTIPPNQVLLSCISDTQTVRVHFLAESGISFYNPAVSVEGVVADSLSEVSGDRRLFQGYRDITLSSSGDVTLTSSTGATTTVYVEIASAGPEVSSLTIDSLPGTQTAVKQGDTMQVSGVVANDAVDITVLDSGAAQSGTIWLNAADSGGVGYRTFSGTAITSSRTGSLPVSVVASNTLGTQGTPFSSEAVTMDQTYPSISFSVVSYNNGLTALGLNDTADVSITITGQNSQTFSFAHGDEGGDTATYMTSRTLTATSEVYSLSGGVTISAYRNANGAQRTSTFTVRVASVAPMASVSIPSATILYSAGDIPSYPQYGLATYSVDTPEEIDDLQYASATTENHEFTLTTGEGEYGYFAYPADLGTATFVDQSVGMAGGWDGATWPADGSIGTTYGPLTVQKDGVDWYVYRTDFANLGTKTFSVTFTSPGLIVGAGANVPHLRSAVAGKDYAVRVTANQQIDSAPQLNASVGAWQGSWVKISSTTWERHLRIEDSDVRGLAYFSGLVLEGLGGHQQSAISSGGQHVVQGFEARTITFPAFARYTSIGVQVSDISNTVARYAGTADDLVLRSDTQDAANSYTIVDSGGVYDPAGDQLFLSDAAFASSNTSGTLQVEVEETL